MLRGTREVDRRVRRCNRKDIMADNSESNFASNLGWFLTGAFIGAAVAVLFAPQSGKDTRHYLSDKVQQSKDALAGTTETIADAGRDIFDRGKQLVEDAADLFERGRKLVKG
jgi:gas vesicle protein